MNATLIPWRVVNVRPIDGRTIYIEFADGSSGVEDLSSSIYGTEGTVFTALRDDEEFAKVYVERGAVAWPCGVDLAPDGLWARITGNDPFAV
ncbi:MAG: DUF2442 domain-containing protein [Bacteroidetes bacterium]|nr:DUF2442 domain-containing protein [Bacteroidota bacterium]